MDKYPEDGGSAFVANVSAQLPECTLPMPVWLQPDRHRTETSNPVFLNRRAATRYRALTSIIPGRERFSWKLSF